MIELDPLPKGWTIAKLGDICFTTSGGTPSRKVSKYFGGNIPWVKSGELDKGLILDTEEKITEEAIKNSSAKVFPKGTLLIALYGATVGKLAFLGIDATTNQAVCGIYKSEAIESKLLYCFLQLEKSNLVGQSIGGAQPNISQGIIKDLNIPLAPLNEQKRILAKLEQLLTDLDKGIEYLETTKQQLKVYRQAVLKWAFEGKLTNKDVKGGELPKGWKIEKLENVSEMCLGKMLDKQKNKGEYQPYLANVNVRWGQFDLENIEEMKFEKDEEERYGLQKGDLIICEGGEPGRCAIWNGSIPKMKIQKALHRLRVKKSISVKFVYHYLYFSAKSGLLKKHFTGTTIKHLTGRELKKIEIPVPTIAEQNNVVQEIESRLSVCDKIEETIENSLQQAEALRLSIIKKAFEGKLVPQDPNDEPASTLLERIIALRQAQGKQGNGKQKVKAPAKKTQLA